MKLVTAIIQPHRLDTVREALTALGINGMTVTEVRGYGRQKGHTEIYRGAEYTISFTPKLKVEVALGDDRVDEVIGAIPRRRAPARSVTARFSSWRWTRRFVCVPAKPATAHFKGCSLLLFIGGCGIHARL